METEGNMEEAAKILRQKGMVEAEKRKEREANEGLVAAYVHPGSRIGALVEVNCETDFVARTDEFQTLVKELTMQVAAADPVYVKREDIPAEVVSELEEGFRAEMVAANKPEHIMDRIISGKMEKYYQESCLLEQPYIRDSDITVGQLVDQYNATLGENIAPKRFARFELGK
jgi:elongation factor Ts